jgi:hypothetical protein
LRDLRVDKVYESRSKEHALAFILNFMEEDNCDSLPSVDGEKGVKVGSSFRVYNMLHNCHHGMFIGFAF